MVFKVGNCASSRRNRRRHMRERLKNDEKSTFKFAPGFSLKLGCFWQRRFQDGDSGHDGQKGEVVTL